MQGGLEPPDALDRQDLGVASVLSRTDGQGADLAGCRVEEINLHKSLYIGNKGYIFSGVDGSLYAENCAKNCNYHDLKTGDQIVGCPEGR